MYMTRFIFLGLLLFSIGCSTDKPNGEPAEPATISEQTGNIGDKSDLIDSVIVDNTMEISDNRTSRVDNISHHENLDTIITTSNVVAIKPIITEIGMQVNFHDYTELSAFLRSHVSNIGKVNYALVKSDLSALILIIKEFEKNYPETDWTKNQKLAYWINAYNVYTLKLVAENFPVSSIKDVAAKPWDKKFIPLGGKTISLSEIENDMIRAKYNEPRIHFALNCASKSCPILLNKAYKAISLSSQLTSQTKRFLNDNSKNDFSSSKVIKLSQIFNWYKGDFTKAGTVFDFINKYRSTNLGTPKIVYLEYSWDLNN
jgi:Protein of unknown function, DUF547